MPLREEGAKEEGAVAQNRPFLSTSISMDGIFRHTNYLQPANKRFWSALAGARRLFRPLDTKFISRR